MNELIATFFLNIKPLFHFLLLSLVALFSRLNSKMRTSFRGKNKEKQTNKEMKEREIQGGKAIKVCNILQEIIFKGHSYPCKKCAFGFSISLENGA